tara:strand:- start:14023 stop:14421 length:399 start_codon:yes stop_codon:yes gene_type:complete
MPKFAELENNIILNVIIAESAPSSGQWMEITDSVKKIIPGPDGEDEYEVPGLGWTLNTTTGRFESPAATSEENVEEALTRIKRSDWAVLPDVDLTSANVELWKTYRASLRSIIRNQQAGDITWPEPPDEEYV